MKLLNAPVQGAAADITKKALSMLQESLEATDARILGCVHDEIILEVPKETLGNAKSILQITMEKAGQAFLQYVPVESEESISDCWEKEK
jgi:DNA polymerase I-like protein with 3'-5' exonuclease and polymerase domains